MIKGATVLTAIEWRRLWAPLIVLVLAISLAGGVETFVPSAELDSLDDTVSIDAVVASEQQIERAESVARVGGLRMAGQPSVPMSGGVSVARETLAKGQVDFLLRNGGIQRAVHSTGPPSA